MVFQILSIFNNFHVIKNAHEENTTQKYSKTGLGIKILVSLLFIINLF